MTKLEKVLVWIANVLLMLNIAYLTYIRWVVVNDISGNIQLTPENIQNGKTAESIISEILTTNKLFALTLGVTLGIGIVATLVVKRRVAKASLFIVASFTALLMYVDLIIVVISALYLIVAIKMFITKIAEPKLEESFN